MYRPACFNAYSLAIVCYTVPVTSRSTSSMPIMPLAEECVIYDIYDVLFAALVSALCPLLDIRLPIVASSSWGNLMASLRPAPQLVSAAPNVAIQNNHMIRNGFSKETWQVFKDMVDDARASRY